MNESPPPPDPSGEPHTSRGGATDADAGQPHTNGGSSADAIPGPIHHGRAAGQEAGVSVGYPPPPPTTAARRLYRDPSGPVGGVATGIAHYAGVDPLLIRLLFVVATPIAGLGLVLYLGLWLVLPVLRPDGYLEQPSQSNTVIGTIILGVAIFVPLIRLIGLRPGLFALLLIGIGVVLLAQSPPSNRVSGQRGGQGVYPSAQASAPPPPAPTGYPVGGPYATTPTANPHQGGAAVGPRVGGSPPGAGIIRGTPPTVFVAPPSQATRYSTTSTWATPRPEPGLPPGPPPPPTAPITAVTLGIAALISGTLLALYLLTPLAISPAAIWGAFALVCGLGLVVSAFGRRQAWLLLLPAAVGLIAMSSASVNIKPNGWNVGWKGGSQSYVIDNPADLADNYTISAGSLTLDLAQVTLSEDRTITISVTAGGAEIIVDGDQAVVLNANVSAGDVTFFDDNFDGLSVSTTRERSGSSAETGSTLTINAQVSAGDLEIRDDD